MCGILFGYSSHLFEGNSSERVEEDVGAFLQFWENTTETLSSNVAWCAVHFVMCRDEYSDTSDKLSPYKSLHCETQWFHDACFVLFLGCA